ncbi:class II glutamine amidotransferase [Kibdelosporangium phytohabitans]|uniref:Glutamine amidotransferase type-2 domain-containing protein n=1 Tax=Kibdelosporangium phytohabitans TaxID=860235 RepID=A0A0N9HP29_9PSEU|nr:class II glutamine amidotransferase [Kibdelosporangium phytohabitans]ALG06341.1 hypothetical protein AOZ06_04860 [Kibdelosporangium phytohabitans]MBE1467476.1 glutamine amidotransferase [Kibdelosporangium phytohabitans]
MLTFFPEHVTPDETALGNGVAFNPHGHGFAIVADGRIIVERDMNGRELIERFITAREEYPSGPALFHSRLATAGEITVANCHPFRVGGDANTVLAHNGIMPARVQPTKYDPRSDTRILAEDFLAGEPFGPLSTERARRRMQKWITGSNKVVILTVNPRYRRQAYVLHEDEGIWHRGIWYSNDDYRGLPYGHLRWTGTGCGACGAPSDPYSAGRVCGTCCSCLDCYELVDNCTCVVVGDDATYKPGHIVLGQAPQGSGFRRDAAADSIRPIGGPSIPTQFNPDAPMLPTLAEHDR